MQSLEPTGTRLLLLIRGITQTGPSVPAGRGGWPLFTPPEGRSCRNGSVSLPSILLKGPEEESPRKTHGSHFSCELKPLVTQDFHLVSNGVHASAAVLVLVSLTFLSGFAKKRNEEETTRCSDFPLLMCGNSGVFSRRPGMRPGPELGVFLFG